ncbi:MAG: class I SAM-dependent methyltransferase [Bacteroidota bacterium]
MQYDPIKRSLGKVFNSYPWLRKLFYKLLDLLLLRAWHIKKQIRLWAKDYNTSASILDAGSGFGQYSYFMAANNTSWQITSVDVKEEQIEDCNQFFNTIGLKNAHFEIADLTTYIQAEQFDLVLSVDVMEHIAEDEKVFSNFHSSLRKGGMLLISTPSDQGGSDVHDDEHESFVDEHVRDGYNIDDIQQKLLRAGFSRVEAKYTYGTPGNISWKLSMKYPLLMLNTSKIFFIILPLYYLITYPFCLILNCMDLNMHQKKGTGLSVQAWK